MLRKSVLLAFFAFCFLLPSTFLAPQSLKAARPTEKANKYDNKEGFVLHEWGVIVEAPDGSKLSTDGKLGKLPDFVTKHPIPLELDIIAFKPIIYFYNPKSNALDIEIGSPAGPPLFSWPAAELMTWNPLRPKQEDSGDKQGKAEKENVENKDKFELGEVRGKNAKEIKSFYWKNLVFGINADFGTPPNVAEGHWVEKARNVDSSILRLGKSFEKFLFYEGDVSKHKFDFDFVVKDAEALLTSRHQFDVHDIFVVRVKDDQIQIAYLETVSAAKNGMKTNKILKLDKAEKVRPDKGAKRLAKCLAEAGLYAKEAQSMASIWQEDFFKKDGTRIIYRLDQSEYDAIYPMKISETPDSTVRVMLVCKKLN